jgi:serine/threonine protein kinase
MSTLSLKPENVLVDSDGYAKITDFGLAKLAVKAGDKAYSFCGTPEYLAPEVVVRAGYSFAADWWTFGAFVYELVVGQAPFSHENRQQLYEQIKSRLGRSSV